MFSKIKTDEYRHVLEVQQVEVLATHLHILLVQASRHSLHCLFGSLTVHIPQPMPSQPPHGCQWQQDGGHSDHPQPVSDDKLCDNSQQ